MTDDETAGQGGPESGSGDSQGQTGGQTTSPTPPAPSPGNDWQPPDFGNDVAFRGANPEVKK